MFSPYNYYKPRLNKITIAISINPIIRIKIIQFIINLYWKIYVLINRKRNITNILINTNIIILNFYLNQS